MSEYWKSTGKKYCDFCKCWTADNKASIDFHERGKNHQNNVKRRLAEIKRNSMQKRKDDEASKKMFQQMEKAALAAVQKDVNNSDVSVGKTDLKNIVKANADPTSSSGNSTYPWQAMTAPQGITYYYNSLTGESSWQKPEVFKNLQEQKEREKEGRVRKKSSTKTSTKDPYREQPKPEEPEEVRNVHPLLGGWSTVRSYENQSNDETASTSTQSSVKKDDSETATHSDSTEKNDPTDEQPEEREKGRKFKEKVMKTNIASSSDEPVTFKKRKTASRNTRKRNVDD